MKNSPTNTSNNYTLKYSTADLLVIEYVRLIILDSVSKIESTIQEKYQKFVDVEKIKYSNSKEYRTQQKKKPATIEDYSAKLYYWTPVTYSRTSNDPHITYSTYNSNGKTFDLNSKIDGFSPSITYKIFREKFLNDMFMSLHPNEVIGMIQACIHNALIWTDTTLLNKFCTSHTQNCSEFINQSLEEFDDYLGLKHISRNQIETVNGIIISPQKIDTSLLFEYTFNQNEILEVSDKRIIDVIVLSTNKKSRLIVYSDIFPSHKEIIGKRVGDIFSLPNVSSKYKIIKIY